jgi:hypothetical protein
MWQWFEKLRGNYALCTQLNNLMMEQMSAYFVVSDPKQVVLVRPSLMSCSDATNT